MVGLQRTLSYITDPKKSFWGGVSQTAGLIPRIEKNANQR